VEKREQQVFATGVLRLFTNIKSTITGVSAITSFGTLIVGIVGVIMLLVGGRAILSGTMTVGDFVMYIFFTGMLAAPVIQMASIGTQVSDALAGLERINDLLDESTEDEEDELRDPVGEVQGLVTFDDVSFYYDEGTPVLKNITFEAKAGTTTALVGSSGSGKSTLVGLVMAFYRPRSGRILVDGRDLTTMRIQEYRQILGVVLQENFLFDGTVAENIRFTNPDATQSEIEHVARIANCHDFIAGFPNGYESIVGERGIKLSGGQRQRIAIARALLANPKILVLDEATSSLDTESETMIQQGLDRLKKGRTAFVIAHRLSTIRSADQILVLEEGQIVERGTHAELMELNGRYRELHDLQHAWEDNRFVNPGEEIGGTTVTTG
jgi:subfamily B ATP-binding cassette protein MsbA